MIYQIIEDSQLAKRNQSLVLGCGGTIAYNAVLSTVFSGESTTEPVTLDEAKNWCRIDVTDDDTLIEDIIIPAAREVCENYANLSFIARTVTAKIQNGLGNFYLPYAPVVAITSASVRRSTAPRSCPQATPITSSVNAPIAAASTA